MVRFPAVGAVPETEESTQVVKWFAQNGLGQVRKFYINDEEFCIKITQKRGIVYQKRGILY